MRNRYFFDKRDMKHFFIKYGIMLLIAVPILVVVNYLFRKAFGEMSMIFLDIVFLCVIVTLYEYIYFLLKRRKERKLAEKENANEK